MFLIFSFFLLVFYQCNINRAQYKKIFSILYSLAFISLISLRCVQTGTDTEQYKILFEELSTYSSFKEYYIANISRGGVELGYALWQWILSFITDYRGFLTAQATLIVIPFSYIVYKKTDHITLSFLLYILIGYLSWDMCAARQAPAVSLSLLSFYLYKDKRTKIALLFYTIAVLFHITALIILPIVFFLRFLKNDKTLLLLLITTKIVGGYFIPFLLPYMRIDYSQDILNQSVGQLTYLGFLSIILYTLWIKRKKRIKLEDSFYMFAMTVVIWPLVDTIPAAFRITFYFLIYLCISVPYILIKIKPNSDRKYFLIVILLISSIYFHNQHYGNRARRVVPYYSIFEYPDNKKTPILYNEIK